MIGLQTATAWSPAISFLKIFTVAQKNNLKMIYLCVYIYINKLKKLTTRDVFAFISVTKNAAIITSCLLTGIIFKTVCSIYLP